MWKRVLVSSFLSLTATLGLGCATIDVIPLDSVTRTKNAGPVKVFATREAIKGKYREIAIISADDEGLEMRDSALVEKIKEKASQLGADGIILVSSGSKSDGGVFVGSVYAQSTRNIIKGIAIVFENE